MLYKPDNIPAKLKQNSAIKIGGSRFYFLLPKQKPKMPVIDMLTEAARKLIEEDKSLKMKGERAAAVIENKKRKAKVIQKEDEQGYKPGKKK